MSCLTGVDAEDKDADPDINALMFMQEPLGMSQTCTDSFGKPLARQNSVLDVLSSDDMLSPVGLGNGPSVHQPTEAHELNSISNDKEEEKNITPLKTVQEITGIWDFDEDSPENSMDNFHGPSDISWDSHKDFMQFLWESHGDSPGEEPKDEVPPPEFPKRRKRKMDMVVMVDPSEDLFPSGGQEDQVTVKKGRKPRMSPSRMSPPRKVSKYTNGTAKPMKHILYSTPTSNSQQNSFDDELSPLKGRLTTNSYLEKPRYPCSKCKLVFKKQHQLDYHIKSHTEQLRPFICKECGKSFKKSGFLVHHMAVHERKLDAENQRDESSKDNILFCPQCPFGTASPDEFVNHAITHKNDKKQAFKGDRKREFLCDKCSFRTENEPELRKHNVMQHTVISLKKPAENHTSATFSCNLCSYKTFSKLVFTKHLLRRHDQTLEEYEGAQLSDKNAQKEQTVPTLRSRLEDATFTSKMSIKGPILPKRESSPSDSDSISDLFNNSRVKRDLKSQLTESKLDKSINILLSRQKYERKAADQKKVNSNGNSSIHSVENDLYDFPGLLTESPLTRNNHEVPSEKYLDSRDARKSTPNSAILRKSPSKRKMFTPFRNTAEQDSSPESPNQEDEDDFERKDTSSFKDTDNHLDGIFKRHKQIIYTYSRRMSMRGALQASKKLYEKIKSEGQDQSDVEIKEESEETVVSEEKDLAQFQNSMDDLSDTDSERKNCPYCPAIFESGVGLSNHIRGHLHRAGLKYNVRHAVSPEQIASNDKRPRIRQRIARLLRKKAELQQNSDSETVKGIHSCPLCGDAFDNRTGQSNHIRGHLKKLGKSLIAKHRSPILLLRELMRDKKELQRAIQILGKKRNYFQYGAAPKLSSFRPFTTCSSDSAESVCTDAKPLTPDFSSDDMDSEKSQLETKLDVKHSLPGNSALIGILKKRKCQEESKLTVSANSEHCSGSRLASSLPHSIFEKEDFKRKACIHCNATFHSGVSLSNHLRACARRKKTALLEGTTLDCKSRRQRLRPGPKKKTLPLTQTPEEMYRLTCRFCDLVFQGPLSVQEDWVKHLQRHIMNTSVPHTGLGMVEVSSLPREPYSRKPEHDSSAPPPSAAS